jgi:hypothetical protein
LVLRRCAFIQRLPCLSAASIHQQEFGEQDFFLRAIAEVGVHRVGERVAMVEYHFAQRLQMCGARVP